MKRVFVPAMVVLACAAISLSAAAVGLTGLPEAAPAPVPQEAVEAPAAPAVIEQAPTQRTSTSAPFPVGWEDDVYCAGWIGADEEPATGRIVAAEYEDSRHMFGVGDIVYSDVGARAGLVAGQEYQVIRPAHEVYRWGSYTATIGRFYETPARARVVCVQDDSAILEITESCEPT